VYSNIAAAITEEKCDTVNPFLGSLLPQLLQSSGVIRNMSLTQSCTYLRGRTVVTSLLGAGGTRKGKRQK